METECIALYILIIFSQNLNKDISHLFVFQLSSDSDADGNVFFRLGLV